MECDHEWFHDPYTRELFMTCYCFCGMCYDQMLWTSEGNGCICDDCFCRQIPENSDCRTTTVLFMPETVVKIASSGSKPIEPVVHDLPEKPGKTGTCRECKGPTYRKGTRGRFPTLCEDCR